MSPKQRLDDLVALREALLSQRRYLLHAQNNRSWRRARVCAAVKMIRACQASISAAIGEIMTMRDRTSMEQQVSALDARIAELGEKIKRLDRTDQAAKLAEKVRKMQAELRRMNANLPPELRLEDIL